MKYSRPISVIGIARSHRFSPNSVERDKAIFEAVADGLRREGFAVKTYNEDNFSSHATERFIFSMARDTKVLQQLAQAERLGVQVINSATALLSASRIQLFKQMEDGNVPVAPFQLYDANQERVFQGNPFWLKRNKDCAQSTYDVQYIDSQERLNNALKYFEQQGIDEIFCCNHLEGDLIKFYGVTGTDFFYAYYPTAEGGFSKFGLESINGLPTGHPINKAQMKAHADNAALRCGISVYGGDGIVGADGIFRIIDFNDWPSFSRCCNEAALAIIKKIKSAIQQHPQ